jgi:hypothetical protein
MEIQIDFEEENTQQLLLTLLKENITKGRVFICDECEQIFLKEDRASVENKELIVCKSCAKHGFTNSKAIKPAEDFVHHQIKSILDKITETEHEYNSLIEASRKGVDWENEIESRRLRIQSLKRSLLDLKHKSSQ